MSKADKPEQILAKPECYAELHGAWPFRAVSTTFKYNTADKPGKQEQWACCTLA